MGGTPVTPHVERMIAQTPVGSTIDLKQAERELGLDRSQIQASMYRLAKAENPTVEVVTRGYLWRVLRGAPAQATPAGPRFSTVEDMGTAVLLRDQEGALWLAKRVGRSE
jgi:hypothetical protein